MPLSDEDVEAIRGTVGRLMKRYEALDAEGLAEMCTDDFTLVRPDTGVERTRDKDSLEALFTAGTREFESLEIDYEVIEINGDGDLAYALGPNNERFRLSGGHETVTEDGWHTLMVFERQNDGAWKMKLQMCVAPGSGQS